MHLNSLTNLRAGPCPIALHLKSIVSQNSRLSKEPIKMPKLTDRVTERTFGNDITNLPDILNSRTNDFKKKVS